MSRRRTSPASLTALLLLLLCACTAEPAPSAAPTRTAPAAQSLASVPQPPFAEDLDPDPEVVRVSLVAEQDDDGPFGVQYTYNGVSPGPTIRAKLGDRVEITLENRLATPTTIHWHGLHVPFEMDGVAWRGAPVAPGEQFTYQFTVEQVGTFWYHPHFNTAAQVDAGLFGAFIVVDPDAPEVAEDLVFVVDALDEHRMGMTDRAAGHGRNVRRWAVNGVEDGVLSVPAGSNTIARFINVSNHGYVQLRFDGLAMQWIEADQGLLPALQTPDHVGLGPGDRAAFVWGAEAGAFDVLTDGYSLNGGETRREPTRLFQVQVDGEAPAPAFPAYRFSGAQTSEDPGYADIVYAFAGSDRTGTWRINGEAFPDVTIETIPAGERRIIEVRNLSPSEHPFHIHGMSFEVLSVNGVAPEYQRIEDTMNLEIRDIVRLAVQTSNRGDWMTHCHILEHAEDGMMTVLRVE
jgi:FtsP/CotA-like multicopper oxidase with cupredoxin domain